MGTLPTIDRNSEGWQKCFTNVPPSASRVSADHNAKERDVANYADASRSSTSTPTSTSPSYDMLKYSHAESLHIRNLLARALRGAYCRAIGDYVVAARR